MVGAGFDAALLDEANWFAGDVRGKSSDIDEPPCMCVSRFQPNEMDIFFSKYSRVGQRFPRKREGISRLLVFSAGTTSDQLQSTRLLLEMSKQAGSLICQESPFITIKNSVERRVSFAFTQFSPSLLASFAKLRSLQANE